MNSVPAAAVAVDRGSYGLNSEHFNASTSVLQSMDDDRSCAYLLKLFKKEHREGERAREKVLFGAELAAERLPADLREA